MESSPDICFLLREGTIPAIQATCIFVKENPKKLAFLDWLNSPEVKQAGSILAPTTGLKIQEEVISGMMWLSFEESEIPVGFVPSGEIYWTTLHKDKVFLVGLIGLDYQEYQSTIELMLQTFKFLD